MKQLLVSIILFTCSAAQAHSGHDHQHWLSSPIHLLTLFSIAGIVAAAYKLTRNKVVDKREEK